MASLHNFMLLLLYSLLLASMPALSQSSFQFRVGGPRGWIQPSGNETETYNRWAVRNRFRVGDSLYFKYQNDSVLVVEEGDYSSCTTSHPLSKFKDGNTHFTFYRDGVFYFISGQPGHCQAGQKLVVSVMGHQSIADNPSGSPGPSSSSGGGGHSQGGQGRQGGQGSGSSPDKHPDSPSSGEKKMVHLAVVALGSIMVIFLLA
ncbi:hypothetical protein ACLOJK_026077 [Asimina triloba]